MLTGNTGILAGQNAGKQAVGLINSVVRDDFQNVLSTTGACLASTGVEFVTMMNGATCVLIQLLPGKLCLLDEGHRRELPVRLFVQAAKGWRCRLT